MTASSTTQNQWMSSSARSQSDQGRLTSHLFIQACSIVETNFKLRKYQYCIGMKDSIQSVSPLVQCAFGKLDLGGEDSHCEHQFNDTFIFG